MSSGNVSPPEPARPSRPGASIFTIEGRAAPGLFVAGWLASILGLAITLVGSLAQAPIVLVVGLVALSLGLIAGAGAQAIERHARGSQPYQGPSPVLVFVAAIPVAYLAAILVGAVLAVLGVKLATPVTNLLLLAIQAAAYLAMVRLLVVGTDSLSWREMGFSRPSSRTIEDLGWGAVFAIPVIAVTVIVTGVLVQIFNASPESPLPPTGQFSGLLLNLLGGALIAPIAEETVFRGVATTAWTRSVGVRAGIVRAALFFAFAHVLLVGGSSVGEGLALAIVGFGARIPVALTLGWVFVQRRSIYASIGLHAAFNGVLLVLAETAARG